MYRALHLTDLKVSAYKLTIKEARQNDFQVQVNWEISNIKLIPGIKGSLFVDLINIDMSFESSALSIILLLY